jgi:hypothetical protein
MFVGETMVKQLLKKVDLIQFAINAKTPPKYHLKGFEAI